MNPDELRELGSALHAADSLDHLATLATRRGDHEFAHRHARRANDIRAAQLDPGTRDVGRARRRSTSFCRTSTTRSARAHAMRNILVDRFRRRAAAKRGSDPIHVTLEPGFADSPPASIDLIDLDRALERFTEVSPRAARVVELRFFAGLTNEEVATVLDVGPATVSRERRAARLLRCLS